MFVLGEAVAIDNSVALAGFLFIVGAVICIPVVLGSIIARGQQKKTSSAKILFSATALFIVDAFVLASISGFIRRFTNHENLVDKYDFIYWLILSIAIISSCAILVSVLKLFIDRIKHKKSC